MKYKKTIRFGAFAVCLGASAAFVGAATGATGAFFSDTKSGHFSGTIGSIKLEGHDGTGGDSLDFNFDHLLPGDRQTLTGRVTNTGTGHEDVYMKFPDAAALHGLNTLGGFGEVHIAAGGVEKFASANLTDLFPCVTPNAVFPANACPVPSQLLLFSDLAPGVTVSFSFAFTIGTRASDQTQWTGTFGPLAYQMIATQVGQTP
jgi:hypothetical protein